MSLKVTIVTVVYNNVKFVEEAVKSVLSQTYENIEYVVIDGGSTDGTIGVIKSFGHKVAKFISEPDKGIYDAMNKGVGAATGDIIGFLNADDIFYDNAVVEKIVAAFKESNIDCVYGNLVYVGQKNTSRITRIWESRTFCDGLFEKSWTPAHPTFYCKKVCYEQFGLYRTDFKIASDTELMYRFLQKHHIKSKYINIIFVRMREAGVSSRGIKSTIIITQEMRRAIIENGGIFNLFKYLFYKSLKMVEFLKAYGK